MKYKSFIFKFYDFIPRIFAYSEELNISFGIGLTDVQKLMYDKMYGKEMWKNILIRSMKQLIDNYNLCQKND